MALPTCACIKGLPQADKLDAIYCALLEILAGQGGGEITVSQISDMTAFWKAAVVTTPAANTYLTSNGAQAFAAVPFANILIEASQISDANAVGLAIITAADAQVVAETIAGGTVFTGTGAPLAVTDVANGIVTGAT